MFSMKNNFSWHFGSLQMTLESVKHVNNPAEMVKNSLQCCAILHENGYSTQLGAMSLAVSLLFSLGVARTLNYTKNQWSDVAFAWCG